MTRMIALMSMFILTITAPLFAAVAGELKITDLKTGTGSAAVTGSKVTVHYTGWLMNGKKFDSSLDRKSPFSFTPGAGRVIPGWEQGVLGMKVGGKRVLIIPPELGYGARGAGEDIPPNSTLKFEITLLGVSEPKYKNIDNSKLKNLLKSGTRLLDIRRPDEWQQTGVVKGSQLLTFFDDRGRVNPKFRKKFNEMVKKTDEVILICRTGSRTGAISKFLAEHQGYKGIINVQRGIAHWIRKGNPVEKAVMPKDCWLCKT